jgi:hypothetical protein
MAQKKLSKFLIASTVLHLIAALAIARIYAEQPQRRSLLKIVSQVRIQYNEPEPPPKPKVVTKVEPKKVAPKVQEPEVIPKKEAPPKVVQQKVRMSAPAPGVTLGNSPRRTTSASGVAGIRGARGPASDLPSLTASGGISHPTLKTTTGGSGLSPGLTHGSMEMPAGSSPLPGVGGKEIAGFKVGASQTGSGLDEVAFSGSGGSGGKADEGPGTGVSAVSGRMNAGSGESTTGLGPGTSDGMGEVDSDSDSYGGKPGGGRGGPGIGGHQAAATRSGPSLKEGADDKNKKGKEAPTTEQLPEEERSGAIGKKEFKTGVKSSMTSATEALGEPKSTGYENALQGEINKNLHTLRKIHEDWQNLKIPNIPRVLQITIELGQEKGKPKLLKADFHNTKLAPRIVNDLTKKIKDWKFESLYDGKDDPEKWPIKLNGKISWQ